MLPGMWETVKEWTFTLPSELPLWELESWWSFEYLECDYRGQNSLGWRVPYIIGKLLEIGCLNWAHMTHFSTQNTSYGQNKSQKKSGITSISLRAGGVPHTVENILTRATTLLQTLPQLEVCTQSYGLPKLRKS
jgi:hypothetical protein